MKMKAAHLMFEGLEPLRKFPSILKELDNYRQLVSLKRTTPKTKKTKRVRKILARMILQSKRLLGIKRNPNKSSYVRYTQLLTQEGKEILREHLKRRPDNFELPKVIATEKWKDIEGRYVQ
jgi:hypothetical protein